MGEHDEDGGYWWLGIGGELLIKVLYCTCPLGKEKNEKEMGWNRKMEDYIIHYAKDPRHSRLHLPVCSGSSPGPGAPPKTGALPH